VELLLICGDFEALRDSNDLNAISVPNKYKSLNSFIGYFNGSKLAPVKTIFIGGNHEASNLLQSLYYGGYVAPNIYYLGCAGVINYKGIRIAGIISHSFIYLTAFSLIHSFTQAYQEYIRITIIREGIMKNILITKKLSKVFTT